MIFIGVYRIYQIFIYDMYIMFNYIYAIDHNIIYHHSIYIIKIKNELWKGDYNDIFALSIVKMNLIKHVQSLN